MSLSDDDRLDADRLNADRLDGISEALAGIIKRQDELDERLRRIESREAPAPHAAPPIVPKSPPPLPVAAPIEPRKPIDSPFHPPPLPAAALETKLGLNWINRIGVITLIFAAAFGFNYAAENNWIGPGTRVALGLFAAVASAVFGDRMRQRQHEIFGQGLTGLGIALSYLTLYASFTIYHVFPQNLAFILMVLTTAAAAALALRYKSQAIAILGLIGGYLTPILLSTGQDHPWILFIYTFLLNLGALAIARTMRWRAIEYLSIAATALLYAGWFATHFNGSNRPVATIFAIAFYAQFATTAEIPVWTLAQLLAALIVPALSPNALPVLLLALLFAASGLIAAEWRHWSPAPAWSLACYSISYLIWRSETGEPPDPETVFALLSCAFMLFLAWLFWRALSKAPPVKPAELLVLASNGAAYFAASYQLLEPSHHAYIGAFTVMLGGIHLAIAKLLWVEPASESDGQFHEWPGLLALGVTLAYLTLAIPIQFAGFRITIAWSLEAAAFAWLAARYRQDRLQFSSWIVFILAGYRLLVLDAWMYANAENYSAIVNARFLTFAVTAGALWLAARFARTGIEAAAPYIAGHVVLLAAFALEITGWAERTVPANDLWSTESIAFSILLAFYALLLIAAGVATRTSINRILGLALLGVVIAKLYLGDVWSLGTGFRITAFLGLGMLLLLVSYLYSRFKPLIERLWKDDR